MLLPYKTTTRVFGIIAAASTIPPFPAPDATAAAETAAAAAVGLNVGLAREDTTPPDTADTLRVLLIWQEDDGRRRSRERKTLWGFRKRGVVKEGFERLCKRK